MMTANIAPMSAAAAARARRRLVSHFRAAAACSPSAAVAYAPKRRLERKYFQHLLSFGAVKSSADGHFYLDEALLAKHDSRRRKRALAMIGTAIGVTAGILGFTHL